MSRLCEPVSWQLDAATAPFSRWALRWEPTRLPLCERELDTRDSRCYGTVTCTALCVYERAHRSR